MNTKKSSKRTPVAAQDHISLQLRPLATPIASLTLDPQNARQHDERGIASVKASLRRFGQLKPVVVQAKGMIVRAGNATVLAAKALGWTEIAANVKSMTDVEARAYAVADNRTAELAMWDDAVLVEVLAELQGDDSLDATVAGYTEEEIAALLAQVAELDSVGALTDAFAELGGRADQAQITFVFSVANGRVVLRLCRAIGKPILADLIVALSKRKLATLKGGPVEVR